MRPQRGGGRRLANGALAANRALVPLVVEPAAAEPAAAAPAAGDDVEMKS